MVAASAVGPGGVLPGEPADTGTYGLPPSGFRLPQGTRLGPVRLQVGDLERSLAFYVTVLGLEVLERAPGRAALGTPLPGRRSLVDLHERRGALPSPGRGRTGLFHFAILLPDRPALGRFTRHLGALGVQAGAGDHLVSEALYLQDPDNLGVEIYADRPRSTWRRVGRELRMTTDPVDVPGLVAASGEEHWRGMPADSVIGHVHLHVGDLDTASAFYSETLGFDRTVWGYPGALFLAAGGYHHHLGTNLWAGRGALAPAPDEAQLLEWTIDLPGPAALAAAMASLESHGVAPAQRSSADVEAEALVLDPWGTPVRLRAV